jgi:hypothetical protein
VETIGHFGRSAQVHLVVRHQNSKPVQGAAVLLAVYLPEVWVQLLHPPTRRGHAAEVVLSGEPPVKVMDFTVQFDHCVGPRSFFVWWRVLTSLKLSYDGVGAGHRIRRISPRNLSCRPGIGFPEEIQLNRTRHAVPAVPWMS